VIAIHPDEHEIASAERSAEALSFVSRMGLGTPGDGT
jgi:hypothetical protein